MKTLTQCLFDFELVEGENGSFSAEYVDDGKANKLCLYFPWCVVQLTTRWENRQMADNNWKWGKSSQNAFNLVGQFFNISPNSLANAKDSEVTKALKNADASDIQVKRTQDLVNATKRSWRNSIRMGAMIHGLVRTGLSLIGQQQQQEATTTKEHAKAITKTRVLSAKTNTAVEKAYLKGAKEIQKTGNDLQRYTGELDEQYQTIEANANQASQQRRLGYRDRAQKRLTANSRPWRNY